MSYVEEEGNSRCCINRKSSEEDFAEQDSIDFGVLFSILWKGKILIVVCTFLMSVASVVFAIYQPNIYRSQVLLSPISDEQQGGLAALANQFGGIASLAGIDLSGDGSDKSAVALEVLTSRKFIMDFIENHDILVPLMASAGWSFDERTLIYDEDIYNITLNTWVRVVSPPFKAKPSALEAYEVFMDILSISPRADNSMIILSLEHHSPEIAKQWLDKLVDDLNLRIKVRDQVEANRSLEYLKVQVEKTKNTEISSLLYQLIEEQTKTLMFTEIREEYIFETIDPAVINDDEVKPNRPTIAIVGLLIGGLMGCLLVLVRNTFKQKDTMNGI